MGNNERILAYNHRSGNGLNISKIEALAKKYGYQLFNIGEFFQNNQSDQALADNLQAHIIAVESGDGTLFTVLRNAPEGSKVVHLPNGGQNFAAQATGWNNMEHEYILKAIVAQAILDYKVSQGNIATVDTTLPSVFHWTIGSGISSNTLDRVNDHRSLPYQIRRIISGAQGLWQTARHTPPVEISIQDPTYPNSLSILSLGYDIVKKEFPYFGTFDFTQLKDLDLNQDHLITYGTPEGMSASDYIRNVSLDGIQIQILHQMPTHGGINLIPISPQTSITINPLERTHFDSEVFPTNQPLTITPQPENTQYSTLIARA